MSAAFGWTIEETEKEVVSLIKRGEILGRVDSQNKVRDFLATVVQDISDASVDTEG